ncbi:MAG: hypothetical protein LAO51_05155 [Acidobacteriia bacterium]|nr:hypothetical protein [Terriglobia bacterium]
MPVSEKVRRALFVVVVAALLAANGAGLSYYLSPMAERMRHPLRPLFKPSGLVGQSFGILALFLFLFLWLYPLRKQFPSLAFTGSVSRWLDFHIPAGILIPFVAATHASWHFTGLIGLGYAALMVVFFSGIVGRYLYTRIPRSRSGIELGREEAAAERRALLGTLSEATGLAPGEIEEALSPRSRKGAPKGTLDAVTRMIADDLSRRRAVRALVRRLRAEGHGESAGPLRLRTISRLARREMALDQQARMLDAIQSVFRLWHAAHRPVAFTALVAVIIHVTVAILVGQTWFL